MSQYKTRGNTNFGKQANVPNLAVNVSNPSANAFALVPNIPNLATVRASALVSSNPKATLPTALVNVANPRSSNLLDALVEVAKREEFGRDKDLKTLLKHL